MILLQVHQLVRQFDADPVLDQVSFEIRPGEKIGLVGPNGAGKSTLLRIIAKLDQADQGTVELHPSARLAMLEQDPEFIAGRTLLDEAKAGLAPLYGLQAEAVEMAEKIASEPDPVLHERWQRRYDAVQLELGRLAAYNIDHRVDEVLAGLEFTRDQYDRPLDQLSGGQRNRAALARLLLAAPDLMLLDEPTNHLDIAATEWLENYLAQCAQAVLVVSHDRFFLDRVANRILELNAGGVHDYPGNFSAYWKQKDERHELLRRAYEKQQEFIARTEDFIRRNHYGQKHAQAADREKKLERLERVAPPRAISSPIMKFANVRRAGDWVIEAHGLTKGYGQPLFTDVNLQVLRGDRLALFGPNGCGKTTLLRTLLRELPPDAGEVRYGANVEIAYYDQQLAGVAADANLIEAIRPPGNPQLTPAHLRDILARFGLRGEIVLQTFGSLSGGEKSKVALARVAALDANVLVLDEPTNHLDLWACAALEQALCEFEGTLLFVSHDRYFIDRVATRIIAFEPGRWRLYDGNYSQYTDSLHRAAKERAIPAQSQTLLESRAKPPGANIPIAVRRKRKFPYRKVEDLEAEVAAAEARLADLQTELATPSVLRDGVRARETRLAYEETEARLAELYEHWEEALELN